MKSILLHACCGPCSTSSIERLLADGYDITIYYCNSNIYPQDEYEKRLTNLQKVADVYDLKLICGIYDHQKWLSAVKGLENEPEKGRRCAACFAFNMALAAEKAEELGIPEFTTTLTVSPHKISEMIFHAAADLPGFVPYNFKKQDGFKKSLILSEKYGLYRQDYCGCEFSLAARSVVSASGNKEA
ncbi:MAG: epoxyqueuosine reductase QueH [Spirochaetia bacterium]|nr:epoxyqueuosine reductase QueH [Spirochaetia bacterium]